MNMILGFGLPLLIRLLEPGQVQDIDVVAILSKHEVQACEEIHGRPCLLSGRRGVANPNEYRAHEINEIDSMKNGAEEAS